MSTKTVAAESVAEGYLALLRDRGIERLYVNAGTDFPSIVEAYARAGESKLDLPEPIIAAHENLAVGMAHGAYLASGRPQAVMLHVSVGTANAICGIMNAARDRIPILLTAGRTPLTEQGLLGSRNGGIHWAQEMFDQAGMLRELVKWDYELRDGIQLEAVVDRAVTMAMGEPRGPIYLTLPREVLSREMDGFSFSEQPPADPTEASPSPDAIEELASLIAQASFPVIVTSATGADHRNVKLLDDLARRHSIGVVEGMPRYVNLPGDHPMHLGYRLRPVIEEADLLCFVDCDVPWMQSVESPRPETVVVQAGPDPLFSRYPIRSHRSDLTIKSSARQLFGALSAALEGRSVDPDRKARLEAHGSRTRANDEAALEAEVAKGGPITKATMNWALRQVRTPDTIIVNEYWAMAGMLRSTQPGTYFGTPPAGGLGWGFPAALGVQQASPDRTVIATLGDGAYLFANPAACHQAAEMHDLPVLSVICTNNRWGAVAGAARSMYPSGHAAQSQEAPLSGLHPMPELERYVQASGGHGEKVTELSELVPALQRALEFVRTRRRQAVVNVISAN